MSDVAPIVLQQIDLDIVPGKTPPIVHVSEYDTGRQILVNLFKDGYPFGTNSIESYTVKVEGSIGKYGFSENADWADDAEGVVVIHLTEAMTAIHGRVWTKIKLIKSESMQISTNGFWMDVDRAGCSDESVSPPSPGELTILPLSVTENGTFVAPTGKAYSPVTVNVSQGGGDVVRASWHQCPATVRNYLAAASAAYSDVNVTVIDQYAPAKGSQLVSNTKPVGYTVDGVTFTDNEPAVAESFATANKAGTLTALDALRWINTTYAATASGETYPRGANCRDLGGWACDGGTIKYGMLVRGGEPNPIDRELMVNKIGIKTEVQLLPLSEQVDAYKMKSVWGIDWAGNDTESSSVYTLNDSKILWRKLLEPILDSVIHAKPVYFHCGIGADRTGMIASALEGLLGVSRADIDMEYELTNFSTGWQSLSGGIYRARTYTSYAAIMNQLNNVPLLYGLADTFRNKWVSFVLSCGIGIDKINAFRTACIEGMPDTIVVNAPTYTITNTLTHTTNNNAAQSIEQYQPYVAALTPNTGYLIGPVQVTMGGTDITGQAWSGTAASMRHSVTNNLTNCSTSNSATIVNSEAAYTATITADSGCTLSSVSVTMGGTNITSSAYNNGVISIASVTGDVVINARAMSGAIVSYIVTNNLTNCSTSNSANSATGGNPYTATLNPNTGYAINSVTITMGGTDVSNYYSSGTINIPSVTGDIVITATASAVARENLLTMNDGKINKRLNSSNSELNANGFFITDYFAFDYATARGLRLVNGVPNIGGLGASNMSSCMLTVYDSTKTRIGQWYISHRSATSESAFATDGNDLVKADLAANKGASMGSLSDIADWTTVKFIRLTLALNNDDRTAIGSVNDVLNSGIKIYAE